MSRKTPNDSMARQLISQQSKQQRATTMSKPSSLSKGSNQASSDPPFNLSAYIKGLRQEWQKITWPSRPQVMAQTLVVVVVVVLFSIFVLLVDKLFQLFFQLIT